MRRPLALALLAALLLPRPEAGAEGERVAVPAGAVLVDDGDSVTITWPDRVETVRLLGIDCPETLHLEHDLPYEQPFAERAAGFLEGCLAGADRVELLRAADPDRYGRTLGYLYADGRNTSVLLVQARLAVESVGTYGDNGLPAPAAEVVAAAKAAGPVPFEDPGAYRARMRGVSAWLKARGLYPRGAEGD
jgi:endonuclease YncB( thermonuclease family)